VLTEPPPGTLQVASGTPLRLHVDAVPATANERLRASWQVDGAPAGEGEAFAFRSATPGAKLVRVVVRSDVGATAVREWRIDVAPPPPPPVEVARATEAPPATEPTPPPTHEPVPAARVEAPPVGRTEPPPAPVRAIEPPPPVERAVEPPSRLAMREHET